MKPSIYKAMTSYADAEYGSSSRILLGISDASAYELVQEADFPSLRIGKRIVVPKGGNCGDGSPLVRREGRDDGEIRSGM